MARQFFGTDGIRGTANAWPMTAEIALQVGMAAGQQFIRGSHKHRVVIGKDTRRSGYMLEPALAAGFTAVGMDVIMTGPIPTPAVAMLTRSLRADLGVMISASHNPYQDNGIKLFGPDGYKLSDEIEEAIEADVLAGLAADHAQPDDRLAESAAIGAAQQMEDARGRYIEFAKTTFSKGLRLDGLKIVIDCANGAAYKVAPTVLWELGADIVTIGVSPNGYNINLDCGSTATEAMCKKVVEVGADIGIALDGDADRVLIADETGQLVDGDQLMAVIAQAWAEAEILKGGGLVATVMSNLGLEKFLRGRGLDLIRTQVGDRYVVEKMRADGFNVGGEQSGHIVLSDFGTTGDGLVAALQILTVVAGNRLKNPSVRVSELCAKFDPYPQLLKNVRFGGGDPLADEAVKAAIKAGEDRLAGDGRLVIRKSGTEPLIRVMAEGSDDDLVTAVVDDICQAVEHAA